MPKPANNEADTIAVWGADLVDQYNDCAAKDDALIRWHNRK